MPERSAKNPTRVVIVGGGCAGMAAAWELAKQPGYDIRVYEKTPRLGGKGSSTRDKHGRILEHGLHVWMGWYENAFRMMRECYAVVNEKGWGPGSKDRVLAHGRFEDAFAPEPNVGLVDPKFHGDAVMWSVLFPPNEGQPGTPMKPDDNPFTMAAYMRRSMELVRALVLSIVEEIPGKTPGPPRPDARSRSDEILSLDIQTPAADSTAALLNRMAAMSRAGALTGAAALLQLVTMLEVWLRRQNIGPKAPESTLAIVEAAVSQARKMLRDVVGVDPHLRMKTEVIDIVLTIMIGLFTDRVMFRKDGLDALNDYDYREWLKLHGATKTSLDSRFIRAAYDFAFAYEDGDLDKPRLAAGVAIRGGFRMFFTYRGAAFWRMCSGMGDCVFAPLYAVLEDWRTEENPIATEAADAARRRQRRLEGKDEEDDQADEEWPPKLRSPVTFHFSHELKAASFEPGGGSLTRLVFERPASQTNPLEQRGGWPHEPEFDRPAQPDLILSRRDDPERPLLELEFDFAIIATGVPEFGEIFVEAFRKKKTSPQPDTPDLAGGPDPATLKAWTVTTELTKTVATKSAQVWLKTDLYDLGWRRGSGLFTCMAQPTFDTYADMTHILPAEGLVGDWRSLAYFCNPAEDRCTADDVKRDVETLITEHMGAFWPHLFDPELKPPATRLSTWQGWLGDDPAKAQVLQYVCANTEGSARYTLSVPGSIASRISPLDDGIDNMTVAGDWTACGLDCGCVEAAVVSGKLAAAAISGKPEIGDIVGYDQP